MGSIHFHCTTTFASLMLSPPLSIPFPKIERLFFPLLLSYDGRERINSTAAQGECPSTFTRRERLDLCFGQTPFNYVLKNILAAYTKGLFGILLVVCRGEGERTIFSRSKKTQKIKPQVFP